MIERFIKDESGMTMALAIITMVLVGVMGAGLLTFVITDLTAVVETNRGQKALQVADAGAQAAKRQLISDTDPLTRYDGGGDDEPWSYCYVIAGCSSFSPGSPGSSGVTLNMSSGQAKVTILTTSYSPGTFKVVSTGCVPDCTSGSAARRKVEAIFRSNLQVGFPAVYFTRHNLSIGGSASPTGVSFFALGNAETSNSLGSVIKDRRFGSWATTSGDPPYPNDLGSYPNQYNYTSRSSQFPGLGALGTVGGAGAAVGSRSYGSNTCPQMVRNYHTDSPTGGCSQKIAFPFEVSDAAKDKQQIEALRQQALKTESPSSPRYIDSNPGDGVDGPGLGTGGQTVGTSPVSSWPAGSTYSTVVFYDYENYDTRNEVTYGISAPCSDLAPKGIIVVQNGDFRYGANNGFNGGIITRAYSGPGNAGSLLTTGGKFTSRGTACLRGYANAGGTMDISGNFEPSSAPTLGSLNEFKGSLETVSWRELYQ